MVSTRLKNISQIGSFSHVKGENKKYLSCHQLVIFQGVILHDPEETFRRKFQAEPQTHGGKQTSRNQPPDRPITLPETNIAPENRPLEKEIPIGNHHFHGLC